MLSDIKSDEHLIPLSIALQRFRAFEIADSLAIPIPVPVSAHLTGAVTRLITFPEGTWAEIEIDDAPLLYSEFRVPIPLHNADGTITRLHEGQRVNILVRPRL